MDLDALAYEEEALTDIVLAEEAALIDHDIELAESRLVLATARLAHAKAALARAARDKRVREAAATSADHVAAGVRRAPRGEAGATR